MPSIEGHLVDDHGHVPMFAMLGLELALCALAMHD
jgi:hypothetical protein